MATKLKQVDAVVVGMGWTGSIMARELTKAGLNVVGLERGENRVPSEDFALPGIRDELKYRLRGGAKMLSRAVSCGLGEGTIAADLAALQERYPDLEIGSYPYFRRSDFGTTLVIRGTDPERLSAATAELTALISALGGVPQEAEG